MLVGRPESDPVVLRNYLSRRVTGFTVTTPSSHEEEMRLAQHNGLKLSAAYLIVSAVEDQMADVLFRGDVLIDWLDDHEAPLDLLRRSWLCTVSSGPAAEVNWALAHQMRQIGLARGEWAGIVHGETSLVADPTGRVFVFAVDDHRIYECINAMAMIHDQALSSAAKCYVRVICETAWDTGSGEMDWKVASLRASSAMHIRFSCGSIQPGAVSCVVVRDEARSEWWSRFSTLLDMSRSEVFSRFERHTKNPLCGREFVDEMLTYAWWPQWDPIDPPVTAINLERYMGRSLRWSLVAPSRELDVPPPWRRYFVDQHPVYDQPRYRRGRIAKRSLEIVWDLPEGLLLLAGR